MEIKRGTTPVISVRFKGLGADVAVETAEFVFKQECSESAPALVCKSWPGEVMREEDGAYRVPFSEAETRLFRAGRYMYMDTRLRLAGGFIAAAPVTALMVQPTLFYGEVMM